MGKRFAGWLLVVVLLLGGGAVAWWWWQQQNTADELAIAETPVTPVAPVQPPETVIEAPEPEDVSHEIPDLGCQLELSDGWRVGAPSDDVRILPDDAPVAVFEKRDAGRLPALVIGHVPDATLGDADPEAWPESFIAALRDRLAVISPAPTIVDAPPPDMTSAFTTIAALKATGSFREMGVASGSGRFVAAVTDDGAVYVIAAFSGDDATEAEIVSMIASLAPLPVDQPEAVEEGPVVEEPIEEAPATSEPEATAEPGEEKPTEAEDVAATDEEAPDATTEEATEPTEEVPTDDTAETLTP